jgi:hypothetical protein
MEGIRAICSSRLAAAMALVTYTPTPRPRAIPWPAKLSHKLSNPALRRLPIERTQNHRTIAYLCVQ